MSGAEAISDTIVRVMLEIANAQPDPVERDAMLSIMRADGLIPDEREAA